MGVQIGTYVCVNCTDTMCVDCSYNADDCLLCSNMTGVDYRTVPNK